MKRVALLAAALGICGPAMATTYVQGFSASAISPGVISDFNLDAIPASAGILSATIDFDVTESFDYVVGYPGTSADPTQPFQAGFFVADSDASMAISGTTTLQITPVCDAFGCSGGAIGHGSTTITGPQAAAFTDGTRLFVGALGGLPTGFYPRDSRVFVGGTITFDLAGSVPEPASWAMMLAGFGAIGATMRRRQSWKNVRAYWL